MSDCFVWMVYRTESADEKNVSVIDWRCEHFTTEGKSGERTGSFILTQPISIEEFARLDVKALQALIFESVNKLAIEAEVAALKGQ